jgi:ZIP family zinc transporter
MAFGAGTLISAVSYELIFEALKLAKGTGFPAVGLFAGAFTFYFIDQLIEKLGAKSHMDIEASHESSLVIPMVLGIILDGIPESIVIGLGIFEGGKVSLAMLVAVFVSNLPEAIAGTTGMRGGSGNSDSVVSGRLASPTPPRGGRREERGDEANETESRGDLQGPGGVGRGQRRQDAGRIG